MATFSLKRKTEEITIEDDNGVEVTYTVRELSGAERDKFLSAMSAKLRYNDKGEAVGMKNYDGVESHLVALALMDSEGKPVPQNTIKDFPASTQKGIFEIAQRLSGLDKDSAEAAKNE